MSLPDPVPHPARARRVLRALRRLWDEPTSTGGASGRLHVCPRCSADCVNPATVEPLDEARSAVSLRCGGCDDTRDVVIGNAEAARFDRDLDRGCELIARSLEALEREHMAAWTDAFIGALRRGLVDADDFAGS